jgi:hypothetical protein
MSVSRRDLSGYESFVARAGGDVCTILVRGQWHTEGEVDGRGRYSIHLVVWGDYGPFEHYWSHCGGEDTKWWSWLEDTDQDYFFKKITDHKHREFDFDATLCALKADLLEKRRDGDIRKGQARAAWDTLEEWDTGMALDAVMDRLYSDRDLSAVFGWDDLGCYARERVKPAMQGFWERIWRPFIEQALATEGFTKTLKPVSEGD